MPSPRTLHPTPAITWLLPSAGSLVLDLCGGNGSFTGDLVASGHRVFGVTSDAATAGRISSRAAGATILQASARQLPFRPRWFDVVTASFHQVGPANMFSETVRVLRPGGHLGLLRTGRDDTVPWVRRLAGLVQAHDPTAMQTPTGGPSKAELLDSGWFVAVDARSFRRWVPVDRPALLSMVERRQRVQQLRERDRSNLLTDVGMLFDDIARSHEVMLPYRVDCLKAWPDPDLQAVEPSITVGIHMRW